MIKTTCTIIVLVALALMRPSPAVCQMPLEVQRKVQGQTIHSGSLPRAELAIGAAFHYAGGQRFEFKRIAEAEQHFFVDAGPDNRVRRFYWLQFEHFLPGNDEHYRYAPVRLNDIGGLTFICDTRLYTDYAGLKPDPESDGARARAFLASRGFKLPLTAVRARLIHLPGNDNRSELMIIYVEELAPGRLPKDAKNEMPADDRFPQLSTAVLQHAKGSLRIRRE